MKYLPYENVTYRTKLSSEEVIERLSQNIEPKKFLRMNRLFGIKGSKPYEGYIHPNSFEINRLKKYRNSFIPQISGKIIQDKLGTKIQIKMKLHIFVLVFMIVWCSVVFLAILGISILSLNRGYFEATILIHIAMFVLGYAMTTGAFKYESRKSKKDLAQIFQAEIEE